MVVSAPVSAGFRACWRVLLRENRVVSKKHASKIDSVSKYQRCLVLAFAVVQCLACSYASAAAIGLPERTARLGYAAGPVLLSADDPDGDTAVEWGAQPFAVIHTDWFLRGTRYWAELYYQEAVLDAAPDEVGQDVGQYGLRFSVQKDLAVVPGWRTWFGGGVDLSRIRQTKRHVVDNSGFLLERFPDRTSTGVGVVLNAVGEWSLTQHWDIGAKVEQLLPVGDGVTATSFAIVVLYTY